MVMTYSGSRFSLNRRRLLFAFILAAALLAGRAFKIAVMEHDKWAARALTQSFKREPVVAVRGEIRDRFGLVLATSREVLRIGIAPREIADSVAVAMRLQRITGVPAASWAPLLEKSTAWRVTKSQFPTQLMSALSAVDGIYPERRVVRYYEPDAMADLLNGASGLEKHFNSVLAEIAGPFPP